MELTQNISLIINISVGVLFLIVLLVGYKKGFISQALDFLGLGVALFIGWLLYRPFGNMFAITPRTVIPFQNSILADFFYIKINSMVWFVILTIIAFIVIKILKPILEVVSKAPVIRFFDQLLGMVVSTIMFGIFVVIGVFVFSLPIFSNGKEIIDNSVLRYVDVVVDKGVEFVSKDLDALQSIQKIGQKPVQASEEDVNNTIKYLKDNGVLDSRIEAFIKEIEMDKHE